MGSRVDGRLGAFVAAPVGVCLFDEGETLGVQSPFEEIDGEGELATDARSNPARLRGLAGSISIVSSSGVNLGITERQQCSSSRRSGEMGQGVYLRTI